MAGALVLIHAVPASFATLRNGRLERTSSGQRSFIVMASLKVPAVRFRSYSSLRLVNDFGFLGVPKRDFHSTMMVTTCVRKEKARKGVVRAIFEKFADKAIKVVLLAQEESRRLFHNYLGTEQILLGIVGEGTGIGAKVLKSIGINLKDARIEVQKIIGRGNGFVDVEIPFTPRAKHVSELSLEEACHLGANYIGSE